MKDPQTQLENSSAAALGFLRVAAMIAAKVAVDLDVSLRSRGGQVYAVGDFGDFTRLVRFLPVLVLFGASTERRDQQATGRLQ